jgi:hypothetical protein
VCKTKVDPQAALLGHIFAVIEYTHNCPDSTESAISQYQCIQKNASQLEVKA